MFFVLLAIAATLLPAQDKKQEPRALTVHPLSGTRGSTYRASIRGWTLQGATALVFQGSGVQARVLTVEPEPVPKGETPPSTPVELAQVEVAISADATPGPHLFRLVTPRGVTNEIELRVTAEPVAEPAAEPLKNFPVALNGRLARKGAVDDYWIEAQAGQTLTFEASASHAAFDPSISLLEPSGSWFDAQRLNRVAFNDEPLFFPGLPVDARLVHRFARAGRYCVRIAAFSGQGGPDYAYSLRIVEGTTAEPALRPKMKGDWDERLFTRPLNVSWVKTLAARGGAPPPATAAETYQAVDEGEKTIPVMSLPGVIEGRISRPAETHVIRLKIDKPQDLAIELETPRAAMPRFNPVVRLLESGGREVATSMYTKLNNCGGYMMKMLQAKTTVSLQAPGEYTLQIHDITTDLASPDFVYRVLVRPQIPHIGRVDPNEDRVNLEPGQTKPITVKFEREEEFAGFVALSAEGLPPGVSVVTGAENPVEVPPLMNGGKVERYISRTQTAVLLLTADEKAAITPMPVTVRILVRPVVDGRLKDVIAVREIPVMVIARRPS